MMLPSLDREVPAFFVEMVSVTAAIRVDEVMDHAPFRVMRYLYGDPMYEFAVMGLNCKSALSMKKGDLLYLFDKSLLGSFYGNA